MSWCPEEQPGVPAAARIVTGPVVRTASGPYQAFPVGSDLPTRLVSGPASVTCCCQPHGASAVLLTGRGRRLPLKEKEDVQSSRFRLALGWRWGGSSLFSEVALLSEEVSSWISCIYVSKCAFVFGEENFICDFQELVTRQYLKKEALRDGVLLCLPRHL